MQPASTDTAQTAAGQPGLSSLVTSIMRRDEHGREVRVVAGMGAFACTLANAAATRHGMRLATCTACWDTGLGKRAA